MLILVLVYSLGNSTVPVPYGVLRTPIRRIRRPRVTDMFRLRTQTPYMVQNHESLLTEDSSTSLAELFSGGWNNVMILNYRFVDLIFEHCISNVPSRFQRLWDSFACRVARDNIFPSINTSQLPSQLI